MACDKHETYMTTQIFKWFFFWSSYFLLLYNTHTRNVLIQGVFMHTSDNFMQDMRLISMHICFMSF